MNDGLFVFLSKGDKEDDRHLSKDGVYRAPLDLRPLTLKSSDSKVAAGCINWIIAFVVLVEADNSSRMQLTSTLLPGEIH